jgi:hypothetical protein
MLEPTKQPTGEATFGGLLFVASGISVGPTTGIL